MADTFRSEQFSVPSQTLFTHQQTGKTKRALRDPDKEKQREDKRVAKQHREPWEVCPRRVPDEKGEWGYFCCERRVGMGMYDVRCTM